MGMPVEWEPFVRVETEASSVGAAGWRVVWSSTTGANSWCWRSLVEFSTSAAQSWILGSSVVAVAVVCPTVAIAAWKIPNMLSSEDGSVTEVGRVDGVDSGRVELL